jgi:hypothetical protein
MNPLRPLRCFTSTAASGFPALIRASVLCAALLYFAAASGTAPSQSPSHALAQQPDEANIIRGIDAAVRHRVDSVAGYSVTESYKLFRHDDMTNPAAAMTVRTTYSRETGKSYEILSQSGSELFRSAVFSPLLENEKRINLPENREASYLVSANYEMHLQPGGTQQINGRTCYALAIHPHERAPNLVVGTIWVDVRDYSIVKIEGHGSKSASIFVAPSEMMRAYESIDGFAMATHAKAVTESDLIGPTIVTIDYSGYQIQRVPGH